MRKKSKLNSEQFEKYRRNVSWIVNIYEKYRREVSWIMKRYDKDGRNPSWKWKDMENMEERPVE